MFPSWRDKMRSTQNCLCFFNAERKHPGNQTTLCRSSKTASPDHGFLCLELPYMFPLLMLEAQCCPLWAGLAQAGRPGEVSSVVTQDSLQWPVCTYSSCFFCPRLISYYTQLWHIMGCQVSRITNLQGARSHRGWGHKESSCCKLKLFQDQPCSTAYR